MAIGGETPVEPNLWLILGTVLWIVVLVAFAVVLIVLAVRGVRLLMRRRG